MLETSFIFFWFFNTTCVSGQKKVFRWEKQAEKGYFGTLNKLIEGKE
jgi:hypothetical protein